VRIFHDHINGSGAPARVSGRLCNYGARPVACAVRSRIVDASGGPKVQGEAVSARMLGARWPGASGWLWPAQGVVLDPGAGDLPAGGAVVGDCELSLSGPIHVAAAAVSAGQNALSEYIAHRLPPTPGGPGAGRGTLGSATRVLTLEPSAGEPQMLLLGDGRQDPHRAGFDELTGGQVNDNGNHGVLYHIQGTPSVPTALVGLPVGGGYYGALDSGGRVVAAPGYVQSGGLGFLIASWQPGRLNQVEWTPPTGSYLPLELIGIPLG
jgi:hypothetical protein